MLSIAAVAAVASYEHAYDLVRAHGETGWTAHMVPLTVDGLIYASFDGDTGLGTPEDTGSGAGTVLLGLGIAATFAANVAHGLGHGLIGAAVDAWSAVILIGSYELLILIIQVA